MSKPSLHELISRELLGHTCTDIEECDEIAEQIIKIVRDYHLVEDK